MMLTRWLAPKAVPFRRTTLALDQLENRENPSLSIQFDYSYDSTGFFSDPNRRNILQMAADNLTSRIGTTLTAITPNAAAGNNWTLTTFNPTDPFNHNADISISNLSVEAGKIIVFVGAEAGLGGGEAGLGGFGGYSASGSQAWLDSLSARGQSSFGPWGGSVTFDPNTNWNFSTNAPAGNQIDFVTVATHELGHVLGFGTAPKYFQYVSGDIFFGPNATSVNGSQYPRLHSNADQEHWQQGISSGGVLQSMQPVVSAGTRVTFGELDYAVLSDIGWAVNGYSSPVGQTPIAPSSPPAAVPIPTSPVVASNFQVGQDPVVVSSGNGTFQLYNANAGGMVPVGAPVTAFFGYAGSVHVATGDVNGDGIQDIVVSAGAGGAPHVKIFDGASGNLIQSFYAFDTSFLGGIFVATGDIDHDGRDDVIITPDVGGGTHVRIFSGGDPNKLFASFIGIETPGGFLGGSRAAAGDINGDGYNDLVVTAGLGGQSHTAILDGRSLSTGQVVRLVGDFFSFDPKFATNGINVSVSDLDGDGFGEVVVGGGNRVRVLSGRTLTTQGGVIAAANPNNDFYVGAANVLSSVRVAGGDFDGNGSDEVVIGSGEGQIGQVFRLTQTGLQAMTLTNTALPLGVFVG